jgi:hypothetical protein
MIASFIAEQAILLKMPNLRGTKFRENKLFPELHRHDDKAEVMPQVGYFHNNILFFGKKILGGICQ